MRLRIPCVMVLLMMVMRIFLFMRSVIRSRISNLLHDNISNTMGYFHFLVIFKPQLLQILFRFIPVILQSIIIHIARTFWRRVRGPREIYSSRLILFLTVDRVLHLISALYCLVLSWLLMFMCRVINFF